MENKIEKEEINQSTGTFEFAADLPNTGPLAVENNLESLEALCSAIQRSVEDALDRPFAVNAINRELELARLLAQPIEDAEESKTSDPAELFEIRSRQTRIKDARDKLRRQGIDPEEIDDDELFVITELSEALLETVKHWQQVKKYRNLPQGVKPPEELLDSGVAANFEWADFLIKSQQRFGIPDSQLKKLTKIMFSGSLSERLYTDEEIRNFPYGIFGLIGGYLHAKKYLEKKGISGVFHAGDKKLDKHNGVDLIFENPGITIYFGVKADSSIRSPMMIDVTNTAKRKKGEQILKAKLKRKRIKNIEESHERLSSFVGTVKADGEQNVLGLSLIVPSVLN